MKKWLITPVLTLTLSLGSASAEGLPDLFRIDRSILMDIINNPAPAGPPRIKKRSEYPERFNVAEFNGKRMTNRDLEKFIENSKLTDAKKDELFREAGGDFEKYTELKEDYIYSLWRPSLKQFLYYKMIEKEATKDEERRAFNVSKNKFWDMSEKAEDNVLRKLLDEGKGIEYARNEYAKFLKSINFPRPEGSSLTDIYFQWKDVQDARIKEQIRANEVQKWEYYKAHPKANPNYFQPVSDIYDLNQSAKSKIREIFSRDDLTEQKLASLIREHDVVQPLLRKIKSYSLAETSLREYKTNMGQKFESQISRFKTTFNTIFNSEAISRIRNYEGMAHTLANRYQDAARLRELSQQSSKEFLKAREGDYRDFMMARLYDLAALIVEGRAPSEIIDLESALSEAFTSLRSNLDQQEELTNSEDSGLILSEFVAAKLRASLGLSQINDDYNKKLADLTVWVLKFEVKRFAVTDKVTFVPEVRDYNNFEAQQHLEAYWLEKTYASNLKKYREQNLKRAFRHSVQVSPDGGSRWSTSESINWIFE